MTMTRQLWLGNDINQLTYSTCYLETRSIVTNVSFSVDGIASRSIGRVWIIAHPHKLFMVVFISVAASITMMLINMMVM
jgi:hypothetical protein